jgi:hypothetical protein
MPLKFLGLLIPDVHITTRKSDIQGNEGSNALFKKSTVGKKRR